MSPTEFHNLVTEAIFLRLEGKGSVGFTPEIVAAMEREHAALSFSEKDYRTGVETFGYGSEEEICSHLNYISDRWCYAFRIRWILDGLEIGVI